MKKRIISLILVLVMSVLALASCGYSYAKDDLSVYATFSDTDKKALEDALKKLVIEDGDFTTDATTRANQVIDSIYADLAASIKDKGEKKTEGVLSGHDILYYCYYVTADFDGTEVTVFAQNMKDTSAASVQLGLGDPSELEKQLTTLITGVDLKDKTYSSVTSGAKPAEGDVVYVSYTVTYDKKVTEGGEEGTTKQKDVYTNQRITLTKDASALINHILDQKKDVGASVDGFEADGKEYSSIKVNWIEKGTELGTAKDVTYTEKKTVTDVTGTERDLKDKELTYHIYPVHYMSVPEYNATNLINDILGSSITIDSVSSILFGRDFAEKSEEDQKKLLEAYATKDGDKDVTLETFITDLAKLQKDLATEKSDLDKANTTLEDNKTALDNAQKARGDAEKAKNDAKTALDADPNNEEKKTALEKATTALESAEKKLENAKKTYGGDDGATGGSVAAQKKAQEEYDKALKARDEKVAALLAMKPTADTVMETKLTEGYKTATYDYLLEKYNEEIRMNLAEKIWEYIEEKVKVTGTPEKAVDETFDQLMQNYEYQFNNGNYDTSTSVSNYKQYNGSFKNYLVDAVKKDMEVTIKTYDEAVAKVREKAEGIVAPIVRIYVVSKAFDKLATDDEFDEYKEDLDNNYSANVYNYGESSVLHAFQFDKLMNYFLEYEEAEDGSYKYARVTYTLAED